MSTRYRVYFTPRTEATTYGDETEVTDYVQFKGLTTIKKSIDSSDYDVGVFVYDDLELKCFNVDGYFNDESDTRSLFKYSRDLTKVRVLFTNDSGDTIVYRGLVNEEATRQNATGDEISFRVLSRDSVIRSTKVSGGTISTGMTCKESLMAILDVPKINSVLTIDEANINPDYNFEVDLGSKFDNKNAREVLGKLLLASNSVMLIDDDGVVTIRNRAENTDTDILNLYGAYNLGYRQNTTRLTAYNTGKHRMFSAVKVNNTEEDDDAMISTFGYKQKKIELDFITNADTETAIATALLDEFKVPKIELNIEVPTYVARNVKLLDRVSLDWPLRIKPYGDTFLPVIGTATLNSAMTPLPSTFGSLSIAPNVAFKVIEIAENPNDFETILKLRQIGTTLSDGVFNTPDSSVVGYAVVGTSVIGGEGDLSDTFNPSVIGAAQIDATEVA